MRIIADISIKLYNEKAKRAGFQQREIGSEAPAGHDYFEYALRNIAEFGTMLAQLVWRRLAKDEFDDADTASGMFAYELIERGEYDLACAVLKFSSEWQGERDQAQIWMDKINLANAHRLSGRSEECENVLQSENWQNVSDKFKISVASLRGETDSVLKIMSKLASDEEFDSESYEVWPVFFGVRDDERFVEEFTEIYTRPFQPVPEIRHGLFSETMNLSSEKFEPGA